MLQAFKITGAMLFLLLGMGASALAAPPPEMPSDIDELPNSKPIAKLQHVKGDTQLVFGDVVVATVVVAGKPQLQALALPSGQVLWSRPVQGVAKVMRQGNLLLVVSGGTVQVLDPLTGKLRWTERGVSDTAGPPGRVIMDHGHGKWSLRDAETGKVVWQGRAVGVTPKSQSLILAGTGACEVMVDVNGQLVYEVSGCPHQAAGEPTTRSQPDVGPDAGPTLPQRAGDFADLDESWPTCDLYIDRDGRLQQWSKVPDFWNGCHLNPAHTRALIRVDPVRDPERTSAVVVDWPSRARTQVVVASSCSGRYAWAGHFVVCDSVEEGGGDYPRKLEFFDPDGPREPPRRASVPLEIDIQRWLAEVLRPSNPSDPGCRDTSASRNVAAVRLALLWGPAVERSLLPAVRGAMARELLLLAGLVCSHPAGEQPDAVARAWLERLPVAARGSSAEQWQPLLEAAVRCSEPAHLPQGWLPMVSDLLGRPPLGTWLQMRTKFVQSVAQPLPPELAAKWFAAIVALWRESWPQDRNHPGTAGPAHAWLVTSAPLLTEWPGLAGAWQALDSEMRARGPAKICPRFEGVCQRQPGQGAWSGGEHGWFVDVNDALGQPDLWLWRWDGATWQGPYYAGLAWFAPAGRAWHDTRLAGWQLPFEPEERGSRLVWTKGDDAPCPAPGAEAEPVALPDPITLADVARDSDGDGWTDLLERRLGTDPSKADSDGDGTPDAMDPAPMCPRSAQPATATALAMWNRLSTRPEPVRLPAGVPCADVATLGGPLLPPRDDGLPRLQLWQLGRELWHVALEGTHAKLLVRAGAVPTVESAKYETKGILLGNENEVFP